MCHAMKECITISSDYRKTPVPIDDIAYITVDGRKTKITKGDGTVLRTNRSLRDIFDQLPKETFSNINRGIVVSKRYVQDEKGGVLTMTDGTLFRRRVRSDRAPKPQKKKVSLPEASHISCPSKTLGQWLDQFPLPLLLMELVYPSGGGVEFLVRYCSREMAKLESVTPSEVQNQSIRLFPHMGKGKWMALFADVAINGSTRVIEDALEESGKYLRLHCYRPQTGYCACVLTDLTKENNLVKELFQRENL
jgi:hypothetical protein